MKIEQALSEFALAKRADGVKPKTASDYVQLVGTNPHAAARWLAARQIDEMESIRSIDLREYIVQLREVRSARTGELLSERSVDTFIRALHIFCSWCSREYGFKNPMANIRYPKMRELRPKAIALEDVQRLLDVADHPRDRALIAMLLDTGARAGGVCNLKSDAVDLNRRRALVTEKGDVTRWVVFSEKTAGLLRLYLAVRAPSATTFFHGLRSDEHMTTNGLRQMLERLGKRANISGRINPHAFRHAMAREYILRGGDLATLSKLLGHRQTSTTTGYYALFTDDEIAGAHERYSPMHDIRVGESKAPGQNSQTPSVSMGPQRDLNPQPPDPQFRGQTSGQQPAQHPQQATATDSSEYPL